MNCKRQDSGDVLSAFHWRMNGVSKMKKGSKTLLAAVLSFSIILSCAPFGVSGAANAPPANEQDSFLSQVCLLYTSILWCMVWVQTANAALRWKQGKLTSASSSTWRTCLGYRVIEQIIYTNKTPQSIRLRCFVISRTPRTGPVDWKSLGRWGWKKNYLSCKENASVDCITKSKGRTAKWVWMTSNVYCKYSIWNQFLKEYIL